MDARALVPHLDWQALLDDLWRYSARIAPAAHSAAADVASSIPEEYPIGAGHAVLATLSYHEPSMLLGALPDAAPTLSRRSDVPVLVDWLVDVALDITLLMTTRALPVRSLPADELTPGLHLLDRGLTDLPLLPFAASIATIQPGSRLEIRAAALIGACGLYERAECGRVTLDRARAGDQIDAVFAHELAHAVDPFYFGTDRPRAEQFADTLGGLLLAHRPASLANAGNLIATARADVGLPEPPAATNDERFNDVALFLSIPLKFSLAGRVDHSRASSPVREAPMATRRPGDVSGPASDHPQPTLEGAL